MERTSRVAANHLFPGKFWCKLRYKGGFRSLKQGEFLRKNHRISNYSLSDVKRRIPPVGLEHNMTRYAVISDIHSNQEALDAVLADMEVQGFDRLLCCGDLVGYGPNPTYCIERFREVQEKYGKVPCIVGNHDQAVVTGIPMGFNPEAAVAAKWTHEKLTQTSLRRLSRFIWRWTEDNIFLTHSSPEKPEEWEYLYAPNQISNQFDHFDQEICFVGHTHQPYIFAQGTDRFLTTDEFFIPNGTRCMVNCGSVGQPRDGDPRASYCLYDDKKRLLTFRRVAYDFNLTLTKIINSGLPEILGRRLEYGY